ncbi:MAG: tRNA lysidine(34) synthetase TilS [Phycisphaerales bacterium]
MASPRRPSPTDSPRRPPRRDPAVASIALAWRELTGSGDRRTLVACSAGCDSSALLLALSAVTSQLVVGHVLHDLRPTGETAQDRDAAGRLAGALGLPFVAAEVRVRGWAGNAEANARRARYGALASLAASSGCRFIATAHHADDQLESVLMGLLRGAGPRGLSGVARRRALHAGEGAPVTLVRPMLGSADGRCRPITRAECERLCAEAGWAWREDRSNADTALLRNALRGEVIPILRRLRPRAAEHAAAAAAIQSDMARLLGRAAVEQAARLGNLSAGRGDNGDGSLWPREEARALPPALLFEMLRVRLLDPGGGGGGSGGADRLTRRVLGPIVRAVRDGRTDPRTFDLPMLPVPRRVRVEAERVLFLDPPRGPGLAV